jgi:hypothetical protein
MSAILAYGFAVYGCFHPFATEERYQQARDGKEYPQQKIKQPAEEKPVEHAVMFILRDGYRLYIYVLAFTFRTNHVLYNSLYSDSVVIHSIALFSYDLPQLNMDARSNPLTRS